MSGRRMVEGVPYWKDVRTLEERLEVVSRLTARPDLLTLEQWVEVYDAAHDLQEALPLVECWVIEKHYGDKDPKSSWFGQVKNWPVACTTQEQAVAMAAAIHAHFEARAKARGWHVDRYEAVLGKGRIRDLVQPDLTPEEYVKGLLS